MAALIDQFAASHFAYFVDAVGELVAAILDMNAGFAMREVAAVDIGNA
jgi:hypothetical protein